MMVAIVMTLVAWSWHYFWIRCKYGIISIVSRSLPKGSTLDSGAMHLQPELDYALSSRFRSMLWTIYQRVMNQI